MKLSILITLVLLNFGQEAFTQDSVEYNSESALMHDASTSKRTTKPPLLIIKTDNRTFEVLLRKNDLPNNRRLKRTLKQIDTDRIISIDVLKGNSATERYGSRGQHGVLIINLKEGTFDKLPRKLRKLEIHERS